MITSTVSIQLICEFEGYKNTAYRDIAGVWTIGYGTTRVNGKPVALGMTCTIEDAQTWLHRDLAKFERVVESTVSSPAVGLSQHQFDACVCFAYNIGGEGFLSSTVAKKIRANKIADITERNFTAWNKVRDAQKMLVESAGLTRRRKAEYHLFATGIIKTQFKE